jgi:predicted RNA-binding protein with RPS1 domain
VVRNLTDFGAFVELEPGVDGLVHVSDMAWTRRISHPSEVVQKGQEVEAMITAMDIAAQRISLSMKELLPNEWDQFASSHQVGDEVEGFVTNITDFGLFVELAPGVEGLCHVSEIERRGNQPLANLFERGQRARTRLIRVDWNERRIGLSLRGIVQPEVDIVAVPLPGSEAEEVMVDELPEQDVDKVEETPVEMASEETPDAAPEVTAEAASEEASDESPEVAPEPTVKDVSEEAAAEVVVETPAESSGGDAVPEQEEDAEAATEKSES